MLLPTQACIEFVKEYVRPTFHVLGQILGEMLPANTPQQKRILIGFSIVGHFLHYRSARSVVSMFVGPEMFQSLDVETLTSTSPNSASPRFDSVRPRWGIVMIWIALKMLMGDRAKYLGLIFGVTFATHLMTQQVSIFMGIIGRTASQIEDVRDADIWVMDNKVRSYRRSARHARNVPASRPRRRRGRVGRQALQGAGPRPPGERQFSQVLFGSTTRRSSGSPEMVVGDSPTFGDRMRSSSTRQATSICGRGNRMCGPNVRDERSSSGAGRRLQGVAAVYDAADLVYAL